MSDPITFGTQDSLDPLWIPETNPEEQDSRIARLFSFATDQSHRFFIDGIPSRLFGIGGINGIRTSLAEAYDHARYLQMVLSGAKVDWVYNRSHGAVLDLAEVFGLNYLGFSPRTAKLLLEQWTEFILMNGENPEAKYIQFCHSQGAIHVKNALLNAPPEIRNRVIVIAIAPAAIVPKALCFDSKNYASKKDYVYNGELLFQAIVSPEEREAADKIRSELILLDPHPEAPDFDHDFQSPTYREILDFVIPNLLAH